MTLALNLGIEIGNFAAQNSGLVGSVGRSNSFGHCIVAKDLAFLVMHTMLCRLPGQDRD
jgi:hypothetical protein